MGVVFYDTHFCIIYAIVLIRGSFVLPIDSLMNAKNNGAMQISCNTYRVGSPPMPDTGTSNRYTNDMSFVYLLLVPVSGMGGEPTRYVLQLICIAPLFLAFMSESIGKTKEPLIKTMA